MGKGRLFLALCLLLSLCACVGPAVPAAPPEGPAALPEPPAASSGKAPEYPPGPAAASGGEAAPPDRSEVPPEEPAVPPEEPVTPPEDPDPPAEEPQAKGEEDFFDGAVFVGDSIMEGIRQYVAKQRQSGEMLGDARFLTSTRGITIADLAAEEGIRYRYSGKEQPLSQLLPQLSPTKVFLLLGLNDLSALEPDIEEIIGRYGRLLDLVEQSAPGARIIVITNTPKVSSRWLPDYTANRSFDNALIDRFVQALVELCRERGVDCVDAHAALQDRTGALPGEYCRDGFLHLNDAGARRVVEVLYQYAQENSGRSDGNETDESGGDSSAAEPDGLCPDGAAAPSAGAGAAV